jgi:phage-related tail fiber protein
LAAAIGDDPNFATTMINALAGKQPLDSTLTALSGKSVSALLEYLGLGGIAGLGTPTGALASGIIRIPMYNGSTVETLILQWMAAPACGRW